MKRNAFLKSIAIASFLPTAVLAMPNESKREEFEMPTPCKNCGEWFDLHEGGPSKDGKYQLCIDCSNEEQQGESQNQY